GGPAPADGWRRWRPVGPASSATASTPRWPPGWRATWTTASIEERIWARIASRGSPRPARRTRLSRRARASAGPLAGMVLSEPADGHTGAVDRHRGQDGVQARPVGQPGVDHRRRPVEPQAQRGDDPLDDLPDPVLVEADLGRLEPPGPLDEGPPAPVEEDLR